MSDFDDKLDRAQANGKISPGDADEVRRFASFLRAIEGVPTKAGGWTPRERRKFADAYREFYPEEYAAFDPAPSGVDMVKADPAPSRTRAAEWIAEAPAQLVAMIRRMTFHHKVNWNAPDYVENEDFGEAGDPRKVTEEIDEAEALSSLVGVDSVGNRLHHIAVDVDVPAWLVPSSTPGHAHLYVPLKVTEGAYFDWLDASAEIGLLEPGYVSACKSRGMTSVRAPWVVKGEERVDLDSTPPLLGDPF
jgi:hypothetical protein